MHISFPNVPKAPKLEDSELSILDATTDAENMTTSYSEASWQQAELPTNHAPPTHITKMA